MPGRSDRLKRLLRVQNQLKASHEMRRAGFLGAAGVADREATEIATRKEGSDTLASLFPELYERRIEQALNARDQNLKAAEREAGKIATETVRTNRIEDDFRQALRREERVAEERDGLEAVERTIAPRKR